MLSTQSETELRLAKVKEFHDTVYRYNDLGTADLLIQQAIDSRDQDLVDAFNDIKSTYELCSAGKYHPFASAVSKVPVIVPTLVAPLIFFLGLGAYMSGILSLTAASCAATIGMGFITYGYVWCVFKSDPTIKKVYVGNDIFDPMRFNKIYLDKKRD